MHSKRRTLPASGGPAFDNTCPATSWLQDMRAAITALQLQIENYYLAFSAPTDKSPFSFSMLA
jgi:hypothetical protein